MLGLLRIVQQQNPDLNTLAFGSDLTALGINLNSQEYVWFDADRFVPCRVALLTLSLSLSLSHFLSLFFLR